MPDCLLNKLGRRVAPALTSGHRPGQVRRDALHAWSSLFCASVLLLWSTREAAAHRCQAVLPFWPSAIWISGRPAPLPANSVIGVNFNHELWSSAGLFSHLPLQLVDDQGQIYPLERIWATEGWEAQANIEQVLLHSTLPLTPGRKVWLVAEWDPEQLRKADAAYTQSGRLGMHTEPSGCIGLPKETLDSLTSSFQGKEPVTDRGLCWVAYGTWMVADPATVPEVHWSGDGSLAYALQDPEFGWEPGSWGLAVKTAFTLSPAYEGLEPWQNFPLPLWVRLWHPALPSQPYDFFVQNWEPGPCVDFWTGPCSAPIWPMPPGPFEVELGLLLPDGKIAWWPHGRVQVPGMKTLYTEMPEGSVDAAGCPLERPAPRRRVP